MDHTNYARWLSVHLRDMTSLEKGHPSVHSEFERGGFVIRKTQRPFSALAIDHAHEQNNKCVKGDGGAIGLTENASQLLRWMVAGPEVASVVAQFEACHDSIKSSQTKGPDVHHHEQKRSTQCTFESQVSSLVEVFEQMGNPFKDTSQDLLVLDTRDIADQSVISTVKEIEQIGIRQYNAFVKERLEERTKPIMEVIKKNKLPLFRNPRKPVPSKEKQSMMSLKQNCSLFSQLYISCQVRQGNIDDFFAHENFEGAAPLVEVLLIDGAALVNMLKPNGACKTFSDYVDQVYLPYVRNQLQTVNRIDIVFDKYLPDSLKHSARSNRGKGLRRRVEPGVKLPGDWGSFLRVDENKTELFKYLAEQTVSVEIPGKQVLSTSDNVV
ncbi:hypothetical protein ACROYT_G015923 [Oculina patagonica]